MKRLLAFALSLVAFGCGQTSTPTLPDATQPPVQPTVERITGTVPVGGVDTKTFTVVRSNGNLALVFAEASPPSGVSMGVGLGQPSGATCSVAQSGIVAPSTVPVFSAAVNAGTYCLVVGDIGQATGPVNYVMNVSHY